MVATAHKAKFDFEDAAWGLKDEKDWTAYGRKDGERIYVELSHTEETRRHVVLRAAKELQGDPTRIAKYLKGLEAGTRQVGATEATARRLCYEIRAILVSYGISIEVQSPERMTANARKVITPQRLDFRNLEAQKSWLGLVNTARHMRNAANNRKRHEGLPQLFGRGNHALRKFQDAKFDKLREQLIERTAASQSLDLLDAGIIAVANAYADLASEEIESLREVEQRIHDKVKARGAQASARSSIVERSNGWRTLNAPSQSSRTTRMLALTEEVLGARYPERQLGFYQAAIDENRK